MLKTAYEQAANGAFLTRDESSASYVIIRYNIHTYKSGGVVEVVKGKQNAEKTVKNLEAGQPSGDHHEGWRYFFEKTDLRVGMDPAKATHLRQADLEVRESQAVQETNNVVAPRRTL